MKNRWFGIFIVILLLPLIMVAQIQKKVVLRWNDPVTLFLGADSTLLSIAFEGAQFNGLPEQILPSLVQSISIPAGEQISDIRISDITYTPLTEQDRLILGSHKLPKTPVLDYDVMLERGNTKAIVSVLPFGINPVNGNFEKIESFSIDITSVQAPAALKNIQVYADNSVLAIGNWYKIYVSETGIYKVTYDDIKNLGVNMTGLNPDKIRIYGNGGAMLSTTAGIIPADDLNESALKVVTANPGVFAQGDYVLFYGQGTHTWKMNPLAARMEHTTHLYADEACYFLTIHAENGSRITFGEVPSGDPNYFTNEYTAYSVYEKELLNILKSGKKWFGEKMDSFTGTINLPVVKFSNLVPDQLATIRYGIAGRSTSGQIWFNFLVNNETVASSSISKITSTYDYARELLSKCRFKSSSTLHQIPT